MADPPITPLEEPQEQYRGGLYRCTSQRMQIGDSKETIFEKVERPPGVRILVQDDSQMLLSREWRPELNDFDYRLPGGKVFDSWEDYAPHREEQLDELAREAAQKELLEETGIDLPLKSFRLFHTSHCGAVMIWDLYYFVVQASNDGSSQDPITTEEGEQIHPQWFSFDEVQELCLKGSVREDRTVAVVLKFLLGRK
jgi:ADP-ribose pyrophosphatase